MIESRRAFLGTLAAGSLVGVAKNAAQDSAPAPFAPVPATSGAADRAYWLSIVERLARPILEPLSRGELHKHLPVMQGHEMRQQYAIFEAYARLIFGIAPWLEMSLDEGPEKTLQTQLRALAVAGLEQGSDPKSPDAFYLGKGQPLVEGGFMAEAILHAPKLLFETLPSATQDRVAQMLTTLRATTPGNNNWQLFASMVEAALYRMKREWNAPRIERAITCHEQWYKGDGMYGDGPDFHMDYYNSFVIQPMLLMTLETMAQENAAWKKLLPGVQRRIQRYATIQEKLISPEATYPATGRSICYRFGVFHALSLVSFRKALSKSISPASVRSALTAVLRRYLSSPNLFDPQGYLVPGVSGYQLHLAEPYISTGSLYLFSGGFLALGLPPTDEFWSAPAADWSSRRLWSGQNEHLDHAMS